MKKIQLLLLFITCTGIATAQSDTTTWISDTTGTVQGIPFTITNINSYSSSWDFTGSSYSVAPLDSSQSSIDYDWGDDWTITFSSPISNLRIYAHYWRTGSFVFDQPFDILSGASAMTSLSDTVFVSGGWGHGIIEFPGPISTLSVDAIPGGFSGQIMTIAAACIPSTSAINATACGSYTSPSGKVWTISNTYMDTIPAASLCDSVIAINLTINNVSDLTATSSGNTITASNMGATYQWLDCDNNNAIIIAETGQSFTATSNGNYAVELTENGCVDTSACVAMTTVGVVENSFGAKFNIFPNPTDGNFSVNLGDVYKKAEVLITDLSGKLIDSRTMSQSQILNLSIGEPAGIYIISIQAADKKAVVRLVKE
jgi:hypothetical protein